MKLLNGSNLTMYYPYFRGKQNELITIRENAELLKQSGFVPIIEPVKESLGGLKKALSAIIEVDGKAILIVNPFHGDHSSSGEGIASLFQNDYAENINVSLGVLLSEEIHNGASFARVLCSNSLGFFQLSPLALDI